MVPFVAALNSLGNKEGKVPNEFRAAANYSKIGNALSVSSTEGPRRPTLVALTARGSTAPPGQCT